MLYPLSYEGIRAILPVRTVIFPGLAASTSNVLSWPSRFPYPCYPTRRDSSSTTP